MDKKPENIKEYKRWLKEDRKVTITSKIENNYKSVVREVHSQFLDSSIWQQLNKNLSEYNDEYYVNTGYRLFQDSSALELSIKEFDSFLLKTFRKNILENSSFPNEPQSGWILPNNWYSCINDIVRTLIKVKYLDGVEFMVDKIKSLCEYYKKPFDCVFQARDVGYYAVHLYTKDEFEITGLDWKTIKVISMIEIQITTQLQELIRTLLHKYYERRRLLPNEPNDLWQWNYNSDDFSTNYLGHILHYIEGMIMEVREKEKSK